MSWKINFLFSSHLAISCAHHKFHYFEGPKPLNHALDIWSMMKMPRDVLYNGFVAVVRRIKLEQQALEWNFARFNSSFQEDNGTTLHVLFHNSLWLSLWPLSLDYWVLCAFSSGNTPAKLFKIMVCFKKNNRDLGDIFLGVGESGVCLKKGDVKKMKQRQRLCRTNDTFQRRVEELCNSTKCSILYQLFHWEIF